ncbi:hypothetical protein AK812_SmicGene11055 [Symbiodinium microadriaticum]|uniref:Uncharacterized protein n=1 Tax=Symbiodinium microadriaticum TaxID=2951 RepID=A0A1Q9EE66_SYMMI|nr:hypothetical protein AK812_SmicGene11055 [Symbiodinium microadriaticum]
MDVARGFWMLRPPLEFAPWDSTEQKDVLSAFRHVIREVVVDWQPSRFIEQLSGASINDGHKSLRTLYFRNVEEDGFIKSLFDAFGVEWYYYTRLKHCHCRAVASTAQLEGIKWDSHIDLGCQAAGIGSYQLSAIGGTGKRLHQGHKLVKPIEPPHRPDPRAQLPLPISPDIHALTLSMPLQSSHSTAPTAAQGAQATRDVGAGRSWLLHALGKCPKRPFWPMLCASSRADGCTSMIADNACIRACWMTRHDTPYHATLWGLVVNLTADPS